MVQVTNYNTFLKTDKRKKNNLVEKQAKDM